MSQSHYVLPDPIGKLLTLLPPYPGSLLFVAGINLALADKLPRDVQRSLEGKRLRIRISDAQLSFDFQWQGSRFSACRSGNNADLAISASAHDFLMLAQQREDPDTLFFARRLVMEGDTELGLLVKNTMDATGSILPEWAWTAPAVVLAKVNPTLRNRKFES